LKASSRSRRGFTLTEVIISSLLSVLLVGAVAALFVSQRVTVWRQRQLNEMHQNLRVALDMLVRDVRMAGYGVPCTNIASWIDWVWGQTNAVTVVQGAGAGDPDEVSIAAAFGDPVSSLAAAAGEGATTIDVAAGTGWRFNTSDSKMIFIGRMETARVVAVSGDELTISTHPTTAGNGLAYSYPAATPIEQVQVVTYYLDTSSTNFPYQPYMMRDDNLGLLTNDLQKMVAVGIEDLQMTVQTNKVTIEVHGRTEAPERGYTDPDKGDHHRRRTLATAIRPRNL